MPSGRNDKVDSAVTAGGCDVWDHFQHRNFNLEEEGGGSSLACYDPGCPEPPGMGIMKNQTSSERWSRAGFEVESNVYIRGLPGSHDD